MTDIKLSRWPKQRLGWLVEWEGVGRAFVRAATEWAWERWAGACGVRPVEVGLLEHADVVVAATELGEAATLAFSDRVDGRDLRRFVRLNKSIAWKFGPGVFPDMGHTLLHELGHVIGLEHLPEGNVMFEKYSGVRTLQEGDIKEAVARYGRPGGSMP